MGKNRFKAVIATDGLHTMLLYNGKAYGESITGIKFSHDAGGVPDMKIISDKIPLPQEGTLDMDTFKKFLEHVMSEDEKETEARNQTVRLEGLEMVMEWLNSQEERCCMMLKENARRKKSFEDELTAVRELKKMILENAEIKEEICSQVPQMDVLVKPIVDWLKTQDPYLEVHISSEYIKLVRTDESIPVSETVSLQNQPSQARY